MAQAKGTEDMNAQAWLDALIVEEQKWSEEQNRIYEWFEDGEGNLVVRARAGTGKTTTIVQGVERASERSILLAAFNKSIATELQSRVSNPRVEAKTLHGLGFKYIRSHWNVRVDEDHQRAIGLARLAAPGAPEPIVKLVRDLHSKAREIDPFVAVDGHAWDLEKLAVQFNLIPDEEYEARGWGIQRVCIAAHLAMRIAMERTDRIDFSDMVFLPLVHRWVRPWFDMVVIDEAQDMTVAQLALAVGACQRGGRICVVGDDRQAIYGFRGADSGSLDRLKDGIKAQELGLRTTYRCPKRVVALAAQLVPDFVAHDSAPEGEVVTLDADKMIAEAKEGDFILSRKNAPLIRICMALLKRGLRARIKGNDIGKGIVALIRKLNASSVDTLPALLVAWQTKEIDRARRKLSEEAADERVAFVCDQAAIIIALLEDCESLTRLESQCTELFADDAERASVMCSSVHRSKGLEADTVYLLQGTFKTAPTEELNIMYVAITRAKKRLVWVTGFGEAK